MDLNALRAWGMAASGGFIAVALWFSAFAPASRPQAFANAPEAMFATAGAAQPAAPAPIAFIVRFRGDGPIARAQRQAGRGQVGAAGRIVTRELARQRDFAGLCFHAFTVGGAEIVLRTCADVAPEARAGEQTRWLARLNAMRAVEYADLNAAFDPARAPG